MFGESFHFTMSEAGLTKIMNRVSEELALKRTKTKKRKPDGKIGRIDSFMVASYLTQIGGTGSFFLSNSRGHRWS